MAWGWRLTCGWRLTGGWRLAWGRPSAAEDQNSETKMTRAHGFSPWAAARTLWASSGIPAAERLLVIST